MTYFDSTFDLICLIDDFMFLQFVNVIITFHFVKEWTFSFKKLFGFLFVFCCVFLVVSFCCGINYIKQKETKNIFL